MEETTIFVLYFYNETINTTLHSIIVELCDVNMSRNPSAIATWL
jgi:hypothetical protein